MNITSIIKKEYYEKILIIDLNEITFIEINENNSIISFKNQMEISLDRNPKDINNDLKKLILDIYITWKKCVENMLMIMQVTNSMEG